jgi:hypothetical protein
MSAVPDRKDRPEYVSLCPSDWLGGCATLPPMAEWVYWQISLYCMDKGEAVPANRLPMILVRHGGDWQGDLALLIDLGKVYRTASGSVFVKRALVEYERADAALKKKRNAGQKGAQKRWGDSGLDSSANGDANEKRCDTNSSRAEQSRADVDHPSDDTTRAGDLIFDIDPSTWRDFTEHRIEIKAPLTARAETLIRNELIRIHEAHGHDPNAVLRQTVMNRWKGVFPLKGDFAGSANGKQSGWRMPDDR